MPKRPPTKHRPAKEFPHSSGSMSKAEFDSALRALWDRKIPLAPGVVISAHVPYAGMTMPSAEPGQCVISGTVKRNDLIIGLKVMHLAYDWKPEAQELVSPYAAFVHDENHISEMGLRGRAIIDPREYVSIPLSEPFFPQSHCGHMTDKKYPDYQDKSWFVPVHGRTTREFFATIMDQHRRFRSDVSALQNPFNGATEVDHEEEARLRATRHLLGLPAEHLGSLGRQ